MTASRREEERKGGAPAGRMAPLKELQRKFGFEPDHVATAAKDVLGKK